MKTLKFSNGDELPSIGLGTWKSEEEKVKNAIKIALNNGYRHIDCAAIYGNEAAIGEAFAEVFAEGKIKREDVWITSKLWNNAHLPKDVKPALEKTLKDLQLDYLDLYLMHWPIAFKADVKNAAKPEEYLTPEEAPIIDTWNAMTDLKKQGLSKHIGVSNFSSTKLEDLLSKTKEVPEMNQVELHPLLQQDELFQYCSKNNIHLTAYSPLGSGDRSDSMKAENEPNMMELDTVKALAKKHNVEPGQILIAWSHQRGTAVIPKSTSEGHIKANIASAAVNFDKQDLKDLADLDRNYRYVNGTFAEVPEKGYTDVFDEQ